MKPSKIHSWHEYYIAKRLQSELSHQHSLIGLSDNDINEANELSIRIAWFEREARKHKLTS